MMYGLTDSQVWYIRTGLDRAIRQTRQLIEDSRRRIDKIENSPEKDDPIIKDFVAEIRGIIGYHEQWLREATKAYESLPADLIPLAIKEPK